MVTPKGSMSTEGETLDDPSSQLRRRIVEAVAAIDRQMLQRVWRELDYKIDICCVTKSGHIGHL
jgi:hypothetical protein